MTEFKDVRPVGYLVLRNYLRERGVSVLPYFRETYVLSKGGAQIVREPGLARHYLRKSAYPGEGVWLHAEFAIKHEGLHLELLSQFFEAVPKQEVQNYVLAHPAGKYPRIVWYLYEWLTGKQLDIPDLEPGHYVKLIDPKKYYTARSTRHSRYRIENNLLGTRAFCPLVRKTDSLVEFESRTLADKAKKIIDQYDPSLISRAVHYLYAKETMSSFEIERERPDKKRTARFIRLLQDAGKTPLSKAYLRDLQNSIVDPRFQDTDYRDFQNYVGESISLEIDRIHYVSPKSGDLTEMMEGLLETYDRMRTSGVPAVITAAVISFGFVFIHPFGDGNGRIHRFLIHDILTEGGFTPLGLIFPVSATMLADMNGYDACLECFSKPLLELVEYDIDRNGNMSVENETKSHYQFIDMTQMAEYLYACIEKTIDTSFQEELAFIVKYDKAKKAVQAVVDMPDRLVDLFIKLGSQNQGRLSDRKRKAHFSELTNEEVNELEEIVRETMLTDE